MTAQPQTPDETMQSLTKMAQSLTEGLSDEVSIDMLCRVGAAVSADDAEQLHYKQRLAMLDRIVVTLGSRGALARLRRALCMLQYERVLCGETGPERLASAVGVASIVSLLHTLPDLVTPRQLAILDPIEREVVRALREQASDLPTLCAQLDLAPRRLIRAHACAMRKLANTY